MAEDRIDSVIVKEAIQREFAFLDAGLDNILSKMKAFSGVKINLEAVANVKEFATATKQYAVIQNDLSADTKIITDRMKEMNGKTLEFTKSLREQTVATEKAASANLKNAQANLANAKADDIRTKSMILQERELERLIALEEKKNIVTSKSNLANELLAGRERILQLRQQAEAEEKLARAEEERFNQHAPVAGTFNPGGGKSNVPVNTPLTLTVDQGNIALLKSYESEIQKLALEQKTATAAFKAGTISQNEYQKIIIQNTEKINGYKANMAALNKEMQLTANVNNAERNSLERAQALTALYVNEKKKLNLATEDGRRLNENYNKAILKTTEFINQNSDAETKRTKNVGNYFTAITSGASKAFSAIRTIAYVLPGLGIAGIFSLLIDGVSNFINAIKSSVGGITDVSKRQKALSDVLKESNNEYVTAVSNVQKLKTEIEAAKNGFISKEEVVKLYNDTIGKTTGLVSNIGEAEKQLNSKAEAYIKFTLLKAAANQALAKSSQAMLDLLTLEKEPIKESQSGFNKFTTGIEKLLGTPGLLGGNDAFRNRTERFNEATQDIKTFKEVYEELSKEILDISLKNKFSFNDAFTPSKKSRTDNLQQLKETVDNQFEIYKISQEAKIRLFERDIKNDRTHYLDKLVALDNFIKANKELLDRQEAEEINNERRKTAREIQHLNEEKAGKSIAEKERINANIKILEENLQQSILLIQKKFNDKSLQLVETSTDTRQGIIDAQHKKEIDSYKDFLKEMKDAEDRDDDRIKAGFKKREEEEKERAKRALELQQELADKKIELAAKVEDALFVFATASFDREKNRIQDQIDLNAEKTQRAIDAVNSEAISVQDKEAKIAIIQARAQGEKERLERRQREIDHKKAVFERAQQVFEVGIETFKAIAKIKLQAAILLANPITAPLAGIALSQIPIALATSAVSIAAILARPIPKFKHGKTSSYEGLAIVGDGGKREPIVREDGRIELSPDKPTLTYIKAKDKVYPDIASLSKLMAHVPHPENMIQSLIRQNNLVHILQQVSNRKNETVFEKFDFGEKMYGELRELNRKPNVFNVIAEIPWEHTAAGRFHLKN